MWWAVGGAAIGDNIGSTHCITSRHDVQVMVVCDGTFMWA